MTLKSVADKYGFKVAARVAPEHDEQIIEDIVKFCDSPNNMAVLFGEIIDETNSYGITRELQNHDDVLCCIEVRGRLQVTVPVAGGKMDEITLCEAMLCLRAQYEAEQIYLARLPSTRHARASIIAATYDLHADVDGDATARTAEVVGEHLRAGLKKSNALLQEFAKLMKED